MDTGAIGVTKAASKKPKAGSKRPTGKKRRRRQENAIVRYFRATWAELKKVQWPNRREATNLTLIVLATTVAMSAFLGIVDYLSALLFSYLINPAG
jgi:preprotein translocase subunit SecE